MFYKLGLSYRSLTKTKIKQLTFWIGWSISIENSSTQLS
jgi:hypothetical protein